MIFLFDESFPKTARPFIESLGHTVFDFREEGIKGSADEVVMSLAIELSAIILTTDRDFFHTLGRLYDDHNGVIVVALRQPNRNAIIERISWFFKNIPLESLKGRVVQLRDRTWLIHPPLEE